MRAESRPVKSSRQLISAAERACRTGQPNLAVVYLQRAEVARDFEVSDFLASLSGLGLVGLGLSFRVVSRELVRPLTEALRAVGMAITEATRPFTRDDFALAAPFGRWCPVSYELHFQQAAKGQDPAHLGGYEHVVETYSVYGEDRVRFHSGWNFESASFPVRDLDAVIGLLQEARAAAVAAGALKSPAASGIPPCSQPPAPTVGPSCVPQDGPAAPHPGTDRAVGESYTESEAA